LGVDGAVSSLESKLLIDNFDIKNTEIATYNAYKTTYDYDVSIYNDRLT